MILNDVYTIITPSQTTMLQSLLRLAFLRDAKNLTHLILEKIFMNTPIFQVSRSALEFIFVPAGCERSFNVSLDNFWPGV